MTETICILNDVPTSDWLRTTQEARRFGSQLIRLSPSLSKSSLNKKRQVVDSSYGRLSTSGMTGAPLIAEYLYAKYIKNLSSHTMAGCFASRIHCNLG
jgi:hypothetical protein